jgi:uncharacterized protein
MTLRTELVALATEIAHRLNPPLISDVLIADPLPSPARDAEFGLLALADGSAGLYYAWMGQSQADMPARYVAGDLVGRSALDLAVQFLGGSDAERSVGIAAINALTAHAWHSAGFVPQLAPNSLAGFELGSGDHLGMVGYFPPLVRRARELGARVSVVERKSHMVSSGEGFVVSLDPRVLDSCNKIICTGATLLNDSLDDMLMYCRSADEIALVGPTVGCPPDPLFARGIHIVAGTRIVNAERARVELAAGRKIGAHAERFIIRRVDYPGFAVLLDRACTAKATLVRPR